MEYRDVTRGDEQILALFRITKYNIWDSIFNELRISKSLF